MSTCLIGRNNFLHSQNCSRSKNGQFFLIKPPRPHITLYYIAQHGKSQMQIDSAYSSLDRGLDSIQPLDSLTNVIK